jgi:two-component system, chemotaxis family, CheB/CheR fusion protein
MSEADEEPRGEASPESGGSQLVVGIGASAGGIKAMQAFFSRVPVQSGAAYVVILHLSPEHESSLAEVLQASSRLPVTRVTESVGIVPDHIYVISPNTSLRMHEGTLTVSPALRMEERRAPVDIFFRTLAETHGARAVAVVLSGTGPNGSSGIKRIKEYGGLVIAQELGECEHDDMPRNSVATGLVDYVLPVTAMPARIIAYQRTRSQLAPRIRHPDAEALGESLREVLTLVRLRTGQDFSHYKTATVLRRIERRLTLHELPDLVAYARHLREHPDEAVSLLRELLISVTQFFRDPTAFAALERIVMPRLFEGKEANDQVRVWVAGCATGEEAYSVAMLLAEAAGRTIEEPAVQVFATDLDQAAIADARDGLYTEADVGDVSPDRLRRFFNRESGHYRVRRELRETVLFAHHNVLKDPPFSHLDLICCRNLLIYLNRSVQERLVETFHFALRPGGILFLGSSESTEGSADLFVPLDKNAHIYESATVTLRPVPPVADVSILTTRALGRGGAERPAVRPFERISAAELHMQMLEQYAPPSIVVTEDHQIVHVSPHAAAYLRSVPGEPSRDVAKLIDPDLRVELRTALFQAVRDRTNVDVRGIRVGTDGAERRVDIAVRPVLREGAAARGFLLILIKPQPAAAADVEGVPADVQLTASDIDAGVAQQLEEELARLKAQLRATIDQYETQAEESKASNEELQAVNEELRSAAEELETSKEELQSVNEELSTVNQELKIKIEELGLTNNDFQNLINSTDIGTIFLDRTLRVKLSTPRARDVFNLLPLDTGRPLSDITTRLRHEGLQRDIQQVLRTLQTVEREVRTAEGLWYLLRVLPYRTTDERIEGVVMTFQDVTARRRAEEHVRSSEERLRLLIDSVKDYAIFTLTPDGRIDTWNKGAQRMFGYAEEEILGQGFAVLFVPEDRAAGMAEKELAQALATGRADDERWHLRKDGGRIYCSGVTTRLDEAGGVRRGFAKIARDLSERRESATALLTAHEQLEDRVRTRTVELENEVRERGDAERRITALVRQLVTAQEDERARVARDIHDHVGQQLTALRLSLDRLAQARGADVSDDLAHARAIAQEMDGELDFLAWQLRPAALDDLGLVAALGKYLEAWSAHHGVATEFRSGGFSARLPSATETTFYRVAQEALNNVVKHAHASRVDVILEQKDSSAVLVIEDDGVGFDAADERPDEGLGLPGMRERAGLIGATVQIESATGKGTTIFLRAPLDGHGGGA